MGRTVLSPVGAWLSPSALPRPQPLRNQPLLLAEGGRLSSGWKVVSK